MLQTARNKMATLLRPINEGRYKAEATIAFSQFITECWEPAVVPHLKASSVRYYGLQIRCHLLPKFGAWKIKDITKAEVQRFLADKRKQGFSGSSVHGMRTALGKVLQAAVDWNYLEHNSARGIRLGDRVLHAFPELLRRFGGVRRGIIGQTGKGCRQSHE